MKVLMTFLLLTSMNVMAAPVARVIEVSGKAFVFAKKTPAKSLKYGDKISDMSDIMVEDDAILSLATERGHILHLTGGSLLKFSNSIVEVKNGKVWFVSKGDLSQGAAYTGNSIVTYNEGEFIYSFDNVLGKTQLLVLTGDAKFSNRVEPGLKINVPAGHFSIVEQKFEKSLPRTPLKVGLKSYKGFKQIFANFKTIDENKLDHLWGSPLTTKRSIASVEDQFSRDEKVAAPKKPTKRGRIVTIRRSSKARVPASAGPADYYKSFKKSNTAVKVKKAISKKRRKKKNSTIKFYGFQKPVAKVSAKKISAKKSSVVKTAPTVYGAKTKLANKRVPASFNRIEKESLFEKSFKEGLRENPRHSTEVNSLIEELKSYKQDYKKQY